MARPVRLTSGQGEAALRLLADQRSVHLRGPGGSGRTHLAETVATALRATGARILRVRAWSDETTTAYAGLHQLRRDLAEVLTDLPPRQQSALRAALGEEAAAADALDEPLPVLAATLGAITLLAEAADVLLVVDDVEHLDAATRQALLFTRRRLDADRVQLLTNGAGDGLDPDATVELVGLSKEEVAELLRRRFGTVSAQAADWVHGHSGGLPLAVVALADELGPARVGGAEALPEVPRASAVLHDLHAPRLGGLTALERDALGLVVVSGTLGRDEVVSVLGPAADPVVDRLVEADLLAEQGARLAAAHPTLGPAVVAMLGPGSVLALHERRLGRLAPDDPRAARHWRALVGAGRPEAVSFAVAASIAAAQHAAAVRAWTEAGAAYEEAAGLAPERGRELWSDAAWCYVRGDAGAAAERALGRLDRFVPAEGTARPTRAEQAELRLLVGMCTAGPLDDTWLPTTAEEDALARTDPDGALALVHTTALALAQSGRFEAGRERVAAFTARTGLAARSREHRLLTEVLDLVAGAPGPAHHLTGGPSGDALLTTRWWTDLTPAELADPRRYLLATSLPLCWVGGTELADLTARQAEAVSELGLVGFAPLVAGNEAAVAWTLGRPGEAQAHQRRAVELAEVTDFLSSATFVHLRGAVLAVRCGAFAEAVEAVERAGGAGPGASPMLELHVETVLAAAALHDGRAAAAWAAADRALTVATEAGMRHPLFVPLLDTAAAAAAATGHEAAVASAVEAAAGHEDSRVRALAARCRALLAPAEEREPLAAAAVAAAAASGDRYEWLRSALLHGQVLRRARRRGRAVGPLEVARRLAVDLDLPVWRDLAEAELVACGRRLVDPGLVGAGAATATGPGASGAPAAIGTLGGILALTPRELDIAREVAAGRTNAEIAQRLFLSRRTVETHVGAIRRKLAVTSRGQIAAIVDGSVTPSWGTTSATATGSAG